MHSVGYIYQIKNKVNGNCYIGSTVNPKNRWLQHRNELRKKDHHSFILQNAWNKYEEHNFEFCILIQCNKKDMIDYENRFMAFQKYNVKRTAKERHFVYTNDFREKCRKGRLSAVTSDETKSKLRNVQITARASMVEATNKLALRVYQEYDGTETLGSIYKRLGTNQRTMHDAFVRLGIAKFGQSSNKNIKQENENALVLKLYNEYDGSKTLRQMYTDCGMTKSKFYSVVRRLGDRLQKRIQG